MYAHLNGLLAHHPKAVPILWRLRLRTLPKDEGPRVVQKPSQGTVPGLNLRLKIAREIRQKLPPQHRLVMGLSVSFG